MFLDDYDNSFIFLNEAEGEQDNPETPEEPTEQNADMSGGDDGMGEAGGDDSGGGGDDMGMGDDGSSGDDSGGDAGGGDDASMDAGGGDIDPEEALKKRMIFNDYKKLLNLIDDITNSVSYINYEQLSPDAKKIFNFIERKMALNYESVKIILTERFISMSYRQLLEIYQYMQIATKSYTEMIKYFCDNSADDNKKR